MIKFKKVNFINFNKNLNLLKNKLKDYNKDIIVCYLFGSSTRREFKPLSDIDIAALFNPKAKHEKLEPRLLLDLMRIMRTEEIDLINLNEAPLRIQYAVLKEKEILYCSDDCARADFETGVIKEYLDFSHILEEHKRMFLQRHGIGGN